MNRLRLGLKLVLIRLLTGCRFFTGLLQGRFKLWLFRLRAFCLSLLSLLSAAVLLHPGPAFAFCQLRAALRAASSVNPPLHLKAGASGEERGNILRRIRASELGILEFDRLAGLQLPVIRAFYLGFYGISLSGGDAELLSRFDDVASVSAVLLDCCGLGGKRRLDAADLRKARLVFPVFMASLRLHLEWMRAGGLERARLGGVRNVYPLQVSIEEAALKRAGLDFCFGRFGFELSSAYEGAVFEFYLGLVSAASRTATGGAAERARYKRFLHFISIIYRIEGVFYEQLV